MARVALGASKVRARRRRRRVVGGAVALAVLAALVGAGVWLANAPFLRIERVSVAGVKTVASTTVEAFVRRELAGEYAPFFSKNNVLLYPQDALMAALGAQYPQFKAVELGASDFSTLELNVVEREPKALWCPSRDSGPAACFFMDEDGVVYAPAPVFSAPVYVSYYGPAEGARLPKQYLSAEQFRALSALAGAVAQKEPADTVVGVAAEPAGDARVVFGSGFELLFSLGAPGGDVFERYALARAAAPFKDRALGEFEYLDLRFGDKLYYKAKDATLLGDAP